MYVPKSAKRNEIYIEKGEKIELIGKIAKVDTITKLSKFEQICRQFGRS